MMFVWVARLKMLKMLSLLEIDLRDILRRKTMIIYHTNEKFTIWEDKDHFCYIQMADKEVEPKAFKTAAEAICEASER
jgi:hypothetical protein